MNNHPLGLPIACGRVIRPVRFVFAKGSARKYMPIVPYQPQAVEYSVFVQTLTQELREVIVGALIKDRRCWELTDDRTQKQALTCQLGPYVQSLQSTEFCE
jgi:hypothetical protein